MTPSPEARDVWFVCDPDGKPFYGTGQPTKEWACRAFDFSEELSAANVAQGYTVRLFRMTPHEALAPHRERVRRLVEAAREARDLIDAYCLELNSQQFTQAEIKLSAALAPFLEQETT
jgi:hypothetical protein